MIKEIIEFIIEQQHETIDTYPTLVIPIAEKFELDAGVAEAIIDTVMEWETDSNTINSLEEVLSLKFPDIVTN